MASTKVPSELIANTAILGQHLHTTLGNTGVTANTSGLHIGQDVATSATVQFQTVTGSHAGTIAAATTGTTQANTDNSAKMATTEFVTNKIQELIGGAPGTLDTLNELAAAINDDADYNSTLTTALALKAPIASPTFTGLGRMNGDWVIGAATGEDKFVIAPQAAGSGTFLISYNDAGNAYEPLTADFETLALRTSGTPRISIASNGDIDLGDTTVKADGQLLVNLTSSDVGASVNAIEADGGFRFRNGNWGIKNNDGSYETWLARSLTGNKTIYGEKLTVDVGNSRLGMNNSSPTVTFQVNNTSNGSTVGLFEGLYAAGGAVNLTEWARSGSAVKAAMTYTDATTDMEFGTTTGHSLALKTGGTRRLNIDDSTGGIGIPGKLAVLSSAAHGSYDFYNNGTSYFNGQVTVDDHLSVTGSSAQLTVGGSVGIGTSSPQESLHIFNSSQSWNQYANIRMSTESDSYAAEIGFHRGTSDDSDRGLFLSGDGTNKHVRVLHGGNVGIGLTSPIDTKLVITETPATIANGNAIHGSTMKGLKIRTNLNGDESVGVWFGTNGSHWCGISGQRTNSSSTWGTDLKFYTHEDATADLTYTRERMCITSGGDVLIGSSTNLNVLSGTPKLQIGSGTGHASLQFYSGTSSVNGIYFGDTSTANSDRYSGYIEYRHNDNTMAFRASDRHVMTLDSRGPLLPAGDFGYHTTQEHYTASTPATSFSTASNITYTSSTQYWPDQGEKLICVINARAFTKYIHIKTNLTANNIMFYFRTKGYFYSHGMEEQLIGGYTYYSGGNLILSKDNKTVAGDTHSGDTYRASDGSLVLKMDINHTGYTEGKMLVFFHSHAPSTTSGITVTAVTQKDDGTNAF